MSLRPIVWCVAAFLAFRLVLGLIAAASHVHFNFRALSIYLVNIVLSRLIVIGLITWACGWIFGERTAKAIAEFWFGLFRLVIQFFAALARGLAKLFKS